MEPSSGPARSAAATPSHAYGPEVVLTASPTASTCRAPGSRPPLTASRSRPPSTGSGSAAAAWRGSGRHPGARMVAPRRGSWRSARPGRRRRGARRPTSISSCPISRQLDQRRMRPVNRRSRRPAADAPAGVAGRARRRPCSYAPPRDPERSVRGTVQAKSLPPSDDGWPPDRDHGAHHDGCGPAPGRALQEAPMAFSGQVLDNPISKERFIFHQTSDDTAGEMLAFDLVVHPDGRVPGGHVHPVQQESFEILRGTVKFRKGLRTVIAAPGDTVVVPPGAFHHFANAGEEPAVVRVRVEPALRMEHLFETVAALAGEGRTLRSGMPKPLDPAVFMREFENEVQAPLAPGLVRAVMAPLAWMAVRRGLDQRYRELFGPAGRRPTPTHPGAGKVSGTRPRPAPQPAGGRPAARDRPAGLTRRHDEPHGKKVNRDDGLVLGRPRRRPGFWVWLAWMVLFRGGLLATGVYFLRRRPTWSSAGPSAADVLDERYARGEIDDE